jgi:acetylornithine deacetylase/succinyl-diaminopimelate desuccinylase-like protein
MNDIDRVEAYIDANFDRFLTEVQELCRIPSIGGDDAGMAQAERWLVDKYQRIGMRVEVLNVADSHPFVLGEEPGPPRSVLFWNHYDIANFTNPVVYPENAYERGPFSGDIVDGKLYARGSTDDKGTLLARVHAVEAWKAVTGRSPVGVKFLTVGKRTVAGPNWAQFLDAYHPLLGADCCIWEAGARDEQDRQVITLGHKGYLYVELVVPGTKRTWPSRYTILPNPAWRLTWLLGRLKGPDERVLIRDFYSDVRPLSEVSKTLTYDRLADDIGVLLEEAGLQSAILGISGHAAQVRLYTEPTLAICGLQAGLPGERMDLVLPPEARAKLEFRLVPDQDPLKILGALQSYLRDIGFGDVEVRVLGQSAPYAVEPDTWLPRLVMRAAERVYPEGAVFAPMAIGFGDRHQFHHWLHAPIVGFAVGYAGYRIETNEEHIRVEDYRQQTKWVAGILAQLARSGADCDSG